MKSKFNILLFSLFLTFIHPNAVGSTLVFAQTHLGHKFLCAHNTLTAAYNALNIDISIVTYPAKRPLVMENNGLIDGEMLRVEGTECRQGK